MNPSLEPSVSSETRWENVLFSSILNHNPLDSEKVVNSKPVFRQKLNKTESVIYPNLFQKRLGEFQIVHK